MVGVTLVEAKGGRPKLKAPGDKPFFLRKTPQTHVTLFTMPHGRGDNCNAQATLRKDQEQLGFLRGLWFMSESDNNECFDYCFQP